MTQCKKGTGHAKPGEDANLLKLEGYEDEWVQSAADLEQAEASSDVITATPTTVETPPHTDPEVAPEATAKLPEPTEDPTPEPEPPTPPAFPTLANIQATSLTEADYSSGTKRFSDVQSRALVPVRQALLDKGFFLGDPIFVRVLKEEKQAELFMQHRSSKKYELVHRYNIAGMSGKLGPKLLEGDMQAPEGCYYVPLRCLHPSSSFHLSFNIGFPNKYDRSHQRTGSNIMMHGSVHSTGCFAMTDAAIEEIYLIAHAALTSGKQRFFRFHVFPFHMTEENMQKHQDHPSLPFWKNLKQGYSFFETNKVPPSVDVRNKTYIFSSP